MEHHFSLITFPSLAIQLERGPRKPKLPSDAWSQGPTLEVGEPNDGPFTLRATTSASQLQTFRPLPPTIPAYQPQLFSSTSLIHSNFGFTPNYLSGSFEANKYLLSQGNTHHHHQFDTFDHYPFPFKSNDSLDYFKVKYAVYLVNHSQPQVLSHQVSFLVDHP